MLCILVAYLRRNACHIFALNVLVLSQLRNSFKRGLWFNHCPNLSLLYGDFFYNFIDSRYLLFDYNILLNDVILFRVLDLSPPFLNNNG